MELISIWNVTVTFFFNFEHKLFEMIINFLITSHLPNLKKCEEIIVALILIPDDVEQRYP